MGKDKKKFTGVFIPAEILAMQNISLIEKSIISDIGYFEQGKYRVSNANLAKKFGVSRRTIINSINRLKSPKFNMIVDVGKDNYHRCLMLNGVISPLFNRAKGAKAAPVEPSSRPIQKFQKPTAGEVTKYAASIGFVLDGEYFVSSYEAKGWMIGKNKMRDWRAAVRTWKQRQGNENGKRTSKISRDFAETSKVGTTVAM